ncbi:VIT family protein [Humibacter antri]
MSEENAPVHGQHPDEPHRGGIAQRLNWLRAGVLGANDGIVSVAAIVVGVAGATSGIDAIVVAGLAALVGGAVSMALGEYVSVSSQRDSERALIAKESEELATMPEEEFEELAGLYREKGLSEKTAYLVATELTEHDALRAHLSAELDIDPDDVVSPWHAALASALSFFVGGALPMLTILLPQAYRIPVTFAAVIVALGITGYAAAAIGGSPRGKAALRVVIGGAIALAATFIIGRIFHTSGM